MSKLHQYADFSNGKQCFVCNSSANVSSIGLQLEDKSYVGPVCQNKLCRSKAHKDAAGVSTAALSASKLLQTHFLKDSGFSL